MISRLREIAAESGPVGLLRRVAGQLLARGGRSCDRLARAAMSPRRLDRMASAHTRALLARNAALRDRGRGRRCFVLASGPSTLGQDLSRLAGADIIAVNEMFLRLARDRVAASVLLFQDTFYLHGGADRRQFLADFAAAATASGALAMIPVAAEAAVTERNLFAGRTPHYFCTVGRLLDYGAAADVPALDFTMPLPGLYTVSHAALALAIYMGYAEIVLLGIDMDFIAAPHLPIRHGYGGNPYTDQDRLSAMEAFQRDAGWDFPEVLRQAAEQLRAFRLLGEIAQQRGQQVFNANPGGLLDGFARRPFDALLPPQAAVRT
jgi:hypothetical protein